jgi:hypothetical protein
MVFIEIDERRPFLISKRKEGLRRRSPLHHKAISISSYGYSTRVIILMLCGEIV